MDSSLPTLPSADLDDAIAQAASLFGVQSVYWDIWGQEHRPESATQSAILSALDLPSRVSLADRSRFHGRPVRPALRLPSFSRIAR